MTKRLLEEGMLSTDLEKTIIKDAADDYSPIKNLAYVFVYKISWAKMQGFLKAPAHSFFITMAIYQIRMLIYI